MRAAKCSGTSTNKLIVELSGCGFAHEAARHLPLVGDGNHAIAHVRALHGPLCALLKRCQFSGSKLPAEGWKKPLRERELLTVLRARKGAALPAQSPGRRGPSGADMSF